jgi:alkylation response protein AidB-like acyl-CoA dehydrogenase
MTVALYHELGPGTDEETEALKEHMHRFAEEVLRPSAMTLDLMSPEEAIAPGSIYWDVWRQIKEMGLHKQGIPEELGGVPLPPGQGMIMIEEIAWGSIDWAIAFGASAMPFTFAAMTGNKRLIEEAVIPYVEDTKGEYIGCWGITEPARGFDVAMAGVKGSGISFDTRARLEDDSYVIRGQKSAWVSNGTVASHSLTFVSVENGTPDPDVGVCVVALNSPGVSKGKPLDKLGQRALNQGELFFDEVVVPREDMVVIPRAEGMGALSGGTASNPNAGLGMAFVGLARAAFEETLKYCKTRVQGGWPLVEHQLVQRKLFDMMTKVETSRAYARAVLQYNMRNPLGGLGYYSNASKVYVTQAAFEVASEGVQLHGGMGLSKGILIEKLFRDARAGLIEDGANDSLVLMAAPGMIDGYAY